MVQGAGFGVEGQGCRVQGAGCGVRGAGCRMKGVGCKVQGAGFRVQGAGFRVQGAGFRVQGSGFRVQGSGCRGRRTPPPRNRAGIHCFLPKLIDSGLVGSLGGVPQEQKTLKGHLPRVIYHRVYSNIRRSRMFHVFFETFHSRRMSRWAALFCVDLAGPFPLVGLSLLENLPVLDLFP